MVNVVQIYFYVTTALLPGNLWQRYCKLQSLKCTQYSSSDLFKNIPPQAAVSTEIGRTVVPWPASELKQKIYSMEMTSQIKEEYYIFDQLWLQKDALLNFTSATKAAECKTLTITLSLSITVFNLCAIVRTVQSLNFSRIVLWMILSVL